MKSVFKSLFKRKSKRHNDSENQCQPGTQYGVSNISHDLVPHRDQDHPLQCESSQHMSHSSQVPAANAVPSTRTAMSTVRQPNENFSRHRNSRSSMIVHEDRQEPYDPRPIREIIQVQQRLNNPAIALSPLDATHANDSTGSTQTEIEDNGDESSRHHYEDGQQRRRDANGHQSRGPAGTSPVNFGLRRQYFHPLPPPDHNVDNGAGVLPNQSNVPTSTVSANADVKGKGKKQHTAPIESSESPTLGSRVQNRVFGNGNPYVVFHSLAHPTPCSTTSANMTGSGSGSGSIQYKNRPMSSNEVSNQGDDRLARIEITMTPSESVPSTSQASGSANDVDEMSSDATASSEIMRHKESLLLQRGKPEFSMHSDHPMSSISAAPNSQLLSAHDELRPRVRKTLSLEWCPMNKMLTTSVPPLRLEPKPPTAFLNASSSRPKPSTHDTSSLSGSEYSKQRVKGPRPIPNFEDLQNQKRRSRVLDHVGLTNTSSGGRSTVSRLETTGQDGSNLVLIKRTSKVLNPSHFPSLSETHQQSSHQPSSSTIDRPSSVLVELSSHNVGTAEQLMHDVQQFVTDTTPEKTHVAHPSAPIPIPIPRARLSRHLSTHNNSSSHATFDAGALSEAPSSPVTSTSTNNKRLSHATSRGTARRIVYSADLEQGLPEGRIARESNFEIVPSNRVSISSRTNSSTTASRYYTRPRQFAEGVDIHDVSTATIVVQPNKRGFGRVRSSAPPQQRNKNATTIATSPAREIVIPLPEPVDHQGMSDSDEELDAARYKAEILKRAAEEAANAANLAAAMASAAAAEVAEARATRRRLKEKRNLQVPAEVCDSPCNNPAASSDSADCLKLEPSTLARSASHPLSDTEGICPESRAAQYADEIHRKPQSIVTLSTPSRIVSAANGTRLNRTPRIIDTTESQSQRDLGIRSPRPSDDADWTPLVNRWSTPWSPLRNVNLSGRNLYGNQRSGPMAPLIPLIQSGPRSRQRVVYVHHSHVVLANEICVLPCRMRSLFMVMDHISFPLLENQNVESTVDLGVPAAQSSDAYIKEQADNDEKTTIIADLDFPDSDSSNQAAVRTTGPRLLSVVPSPTSLVSSPMGAEPGPLRRSRSLSSKASSRHLSPTTDAARPTQVLINGMTPEELISSIRFENDREGTAGYYGPREYARDEEHKRLQESRDAALVPSAESRLMPILRRVQSLAEMFYGGREASTDDNQGSSGGI